MRGSAWASMGTPYRCTNFGKESLVRILCVRRAQEFNKQHDEGEHLGQHGDTKQMHQSAIKKEEQHKEKEINDTDFAYTIAAARRSEQRRLL